jgi:hypothetical protein
MLHGRCKGTGRYSALYCTNYRVTTVTKNKQLLQQRYVIVPMPLFLLVMNEIQLSSGDLLSPLQTSEAPVTDCLQTASVPYWCGPYMLHTKPIVQLNSGRCGMVEFISLMITFWIMTKNKHPVFVRNAVRQGGNMKLLSSHTSRFYKVQET